MPDRALLMNDTNAEQLITPKELAALLRVSKVLVYRMVERREIAFYRLPRGLRFRRADVDEFIRRIRVERFGL